MADEQLGGANVSGAKFPHAGHDARRTYTTLLVEAGVPKPRRVLYLGHGPQTVTDLSEWSEVKKDLEENAGRVRELIGTDERALRLMP